MAKASPDSSSDLENGHDEKQSQIQSPTRLSHWRILTDQGITTPEIENWPYDGSGTEEDPFQVTWIDNDPRNPMEFGDHYKWMIVLAMAFAVLGVSLNSSMYSGGLNPLVAQFHVSDEVGILGLSLFVLGFALGPLFWAPFSEMFGRQVVFFCTYGAFVAWNSGLGGAQNIQTIIVLRFLAGSFGSSPLTNAGGVIADCFPARKRGLAMSIFAAAPFLGPALGPVMGGFLGEGAGWRWVMGFMAAFSGVAWIIGFLLVPETFAPVLLRRRAERLSKITGHVYLSRVDIDRGKQTLGQSMRLALTRPWILLFREPIVILLSTYMAIVYGSLYMLFAAYPIVYQQGRGWSEGIGGLAFLGVLIGMSSAVAFSIFVVNPFYERVVDREGGTAPPEARLPSAMLGGILIPVGFFWFAWTDGPHMPWAVSMAAGIPFGFGMVLVFLSIMNYLVDSYTIFAASVMAANTILRSTFGATFPLFTTYMFEGLGVHWAASIPAFLSLACVPFPFLFYKYGAQIRARCKFAAEADAFMQRLRTRQQQEQQQEQLDTSDADDVAAETGVTVGSGGKGLLPEVDASEPEEAEWEKEREAEMGPTHHKRQPHVRQQSGDQQLYRPHSRRLEQIKSNSSRRSGRAGTPTGSIGPVTSATGTGVAAAGVEWDDNPYTIDRVNTRESFRSERSGKDKR